jgi:hypothetical protein
MQTDKENEKNPKPVDEKNDLYFRNRDQIKEVDGAQRAGGPSKGGSGVPDESEESDDELDSHGHPHSWTEGQKSGPAQDTGSSGGGQAREKSGPL